MVAIAGGAILILDIDGDEASVYCSSGKVWYEGGCNVQGPTFGGVASQEDFYTTLTSTTIPDWEDVHIWNNHIGTNNQYGEFRVTTKLKPQEGSTEQPVLSTVFYSWSDRTDKYTIIHHSDDSVQCTKESITGTQGGGLDASVYFTFNTNTQAQLLGCGASVGYSATECLWRVWDGNTQVGSFSSQRIVTDKVTGIPSKWRVRVCTKSTEGECDTAVKDWNYCAGDTAGHTLSAGCSCASWNPTSSVEWCGNVNYWLDVNTGTYNSAATQLPTWNGNALCVDKATADAAGFEYPQSTPNYDSALSSPPANTQLTWYTGGVTPSKAGIKIQGWGDLWTGYQSYSASGGKYGRWCGKGGNINVQQCPTTSGSVCNDGGFDSCCKTHDHGVSGRDLWGVMTISKCQVDKDFKSCRNAAGSCTSGLSNCLGNHKGCDSASSCSSSKTGANALFDILPCDNWERTSYWSWCSWYPCKKYRYEYVERWPWGSYGSYSCNGGCYKW